MITEPSYQENFLCNETCQPRECYQGEVSVWDSECEAIESSAEGLIARTSIPNNISGPNLATGIQALHSNRDCIFTV